MQELDVVGKSYPQVDAIDKARGRTKFVSDLVVPNMLHGRILRSPLAHARILSLDTSQAEQLPGVKAVVTYADTPGVPFGPRTEDWTILAKDKVRFCGDEVAAVAAIDQNTAEEALELIQVEYEELPYVVDPVEAMQPGAPLVHEDRDSNVAFEYAVEVGDVDAAFQNAHYVYEDSYFTNQVYQAYLEPMGALVDVDSTGRITFWVGTQIPNMMRLTYARALDIPLDQIRIIVPDYGGAFGGKMEHNTHLIAAVLAKKAGRPVKLFHTRHDDIVAGNPRVPMHIDIKLGVDRDGLLMAKDVRIVGGAGSRVVYAHAIVATACNRVDSLYKFQNVRAKGYTVYTNTVPTSCYRGFGNAQMTFVLESAMDMVADQLKVDPAELRIRNGMDPGDVSIHGWEIKSCGLKECVQRATVASEWKEKRQRRESLTGIGLSCCNHVSGNRAFSREFDGSAGIVHIGRDGRILVYHGESDMGQGQKTTFAQIVAERLGVPLEMVHVATVDTEVSPFGMGSFATRGTLMGGNGVLAAADNAYQQLLGVAAEMLDAPPTDIACRKGDFFVRSSPESRVGFKLVAEQAALERMGAPIIGFGTYNPGTVLPDPVTKYGNISPAYPFACQIAEVEVDPNTGHVDVKRITAAHDVGRAINPMATEGQVHGGVTQGFGWALMENMVMEGGVIANANMLDYVTPTAMDVPEITPILVEPIDPNGPYGAKGIGEPALNPTMSAITNAIYHATGIRITKLPVSAEEILSKLREQDT
jgi:CO/xanthine dehydrogenase Mo-binding subunit